jgi:hypothetical protein
LYLDVVFPGPRPDADEPLPEVLERSPGWWAALSLNRVPRWLFAVAAVVLLAAGGGTALVLSQPGHRPPPVVHTAYFMPAACAEFINMTSTHLQPGYRVVFGDAAVPPAYLAPQLRGTGSKPWRYDWKIGFGFRGGGLPVSISVPPAWENRVALFGPSNGFGQVTELLIPSCPPRGVWNTFVSGFFMQTPAECVPLNIQVGRQTTTVWFGLDRHCPASLTNIQPSGS